jgi:hypothetical protein
VGVFTTGVERVDAELLALKARPTANQRELAAAVERHLAGDEQPPADEVRVAVARPDRAVDDDRFAAGRLAQHAHERGGREEEPLEDGEARGELGARGGVRRAHALRELHELGSRLFGAMARLVDLLKGAIKQLAQPCRAHLVLLRAHLLDYSLDTRI